MYEDLGKEYWVIDVKNVEILALAIIDLEGVKGSYRTKNKASFHKKEGSHCEPSFLWKLRLQILNQRRNHKRIDLQQLVHQYQQQ
jgi:hypothetical protein